MKTFLIALLGLVALAISVRAAEEETTHMAGRAAKAPGHPGYAQVSDDDKAMDRAVEHAQRSLGFFMAVLPAKKPGDSTFEIKKGFVRWGQSGASVDQQRHVRRQKFSRQDRITAATTVDTISCMNGEGVGMEAGTGRSRKSGVQIRD